MFVRYLRLSMALLDRQWLLLRAGSHMTNQGPDLSRIGAIEEPLAPG